MAALTVGDIIVGGILVCASVIVLFIMAYEERKIMREKEENGNDDWPYGC